MHDDVIKWKHFPRYWPFVRGIHRSPVNSSHKGQWRGALMFSLICVWINDWVNNREAGDLRRYRAHSDVIVMWHHFAPGSCWRLSMPSLLWCVVIVLSHNEISPSSEQPEWRLFTDILWQPIAGFIVIFHKYCCCTKHGGIVTNVTL